MLNAKQHEREAQIIKDAGQRGAVTIATNMAGRGVDIKLGEGVRELGGLYILGTERHESRRIDNQLRGRSGRQGDPGETRFFLSAEDDLVRLFAGDRIYTILDKLGPGEGEPIEHRMLTKRIEGAQKRVEEQNFDIRKNVLKYDDVLNKQRERDLRRAPRGARGRRPARAGARVDRRGRRGHRRGPHRLAVPRGVGPRRHVRGLHSIFPVSFDRRGPRPARRGSTARS